MSKYTKQANDMRNARGLGMMFLDDGQHAPAPVAVPILTRVPHDTMPGLVLDRVAMYRLPVSRKEMRP